MAKKPVRSSAANVPSIPLDIQRALRSIEQIAQTAQSRADDALADLPTKVSKLSEDDLLSVARFVRSQLIAGGRMPLDLTALNGQTGINQQALIPTVSMLPPRSHPFARYGQAVIYKNQLYVFNRLVGSTGQSPTNPGGGSSPGTFQPVAAQPFYVQSVQSMLATLAASLSSAAAGLLVWVTDYNHVLEWNGSGFGWGPGDTGSGYMQAFAVNPPTAAGWHLCDGTSVNYLRSDGTLGTITLPLAAGSYVKFGAAYTPTVDAANTPVFTGSPAVSDIVVSTGTTPVVGDAVEFPYTPMGAISLAGDPIPYFTGVLYFRQ